MVLINFIPVISSGQGEGGGQSFFPFINFDDDGSGSDSGVNSLLNKKFGFFYAIKWSHLSNSSR